MAEQDFSRLLETITQLNNQLTIANKTIDQLQRNFSATGLEDFNRALARQKDAARQLTGDLEKVQREYNQLRSSAENSAVTTIPHPPGVTPPMVSSRTTEDTLRAKLILSSYGKVESEQEALVKSLRNRVITEEKYTQALKQATQLGFTVNDLVKSQTRGVAGIEQLQFQRQDASGVSRRFDTFVTPGGRATPGVGNQFRTFGQGVMRDIGEFTKWSIALAAVYGPLQKLQELTQVMIENQTKLAEATISVGSSFLDQAGIFDIAAESASRAGESIGGVIDAFTQAYRATGGVGDQVERLATAQNLLNDSLILSKLSTLDQASAIDTLSAALRQTGGDLNKGSELLDKWVRVTKIANVDLASLATGFAVLGDAAEAAQIDTDQLNGILAAIAETGVASGRELANTARAIVAGFQSDQARQQLENLGIAFQDSTGQARPFLEVMQEISNLRKAGVIDNTAFSKLTLALGGGTRRQAAYATFIENFGRVGEVAAESSRAAGDAQAALAKQLDTVQTSLTRLGNAFQELAQTLGTEGGFLGIITEGVNGLTAMVKVFDGLTSVLGKATPALAAFIATSMVLKYKGQGGIQQALGGVGLGLQPDEYASRLAGAGQGLSAGVPLPFGQRAKGFTGASILGTNAISGIFQGLAVSAIPALMNAMNKEDKFGKTKAGADIVGGVAGGIVGSLVAGSPIIGAAIGTAVAEAFVNSTIARKTDIFGYTKAPTLAEAGKTPGQADNLDEALNQAQTKLYKDIGFGNENFGRFLTSGAEKTGQRLVDRLNEAIKNQDPQELQKVFAGRYGQANAQFLASIGLSQETINQAFQQKRQIEFHPEYVDFTRASANAQKEFRQAEAARLARGGTPGDERTAFSQLAQQNSTAFKDVISAVRETSRQQLSQQRITGQVTGAEYGRRTEAIGGFDVKAVQYYTALGNKVSDLSGGVNNAAREFEVLNNVIVKGPQDALPQMTSLVGQIEELVNLLSDPVLNKERLLEFGGAEEAKKQLEDLRTTLANLVKDANQQALLSGLQIPNVQGDINKPLQKQEFNQVSQRAQQLQDQFYKGFLKIPDDMYSALKKSWDDWAQIVEDSGKKFYETVSEIDPQFFQQAMQELIQEGKLKSQETSPFGIQQLDISSKQGAGLQGSIDYYSRYLSKNFPQYQQKPEEFGVIFNDYVTSVLHGDNLAVKLALEKLVDINQKQLDGMYNIPEGATFWVPITAAYYRPQNNNNGVGGGLPSVDPGLPANTNATAENTSAVLSLKDALTERKDKQISDFESTFYKKGAVSPKDKLTELKDKRISDMESSFYAKDTTQALKFRGDLGYSRQAQELRGGLNNQTGAQQVNPQLTARLDLRIDNNTQLIVDGRVLASVITPYLASDLLRLESAQGTVTKRYVI